MGDPLNSRLETIEKPVESDYLNCIRCGLCLAVCPTYREHLVETASPRGRVALTRKGLEGELVLGPRLFEQLYSCFACMACSELCPVGIQPAELALQMRYTQEQLRPSRWKTALFGRFMSDPSRMRMATWPLRIYEHSRMRRLVYALGLPRMLPRKLRDMEAMLPHLPQRPLIHSLPEVTQSTRPGPVVRVGFFLGCAQNLMFADESAATVRVLAHNRCTVVTPRATQCCGMPAFGYGRQDIVRTMARHNIKLFEEARVDFVVTDCATCGSTLKNYGAMLASDPQWAERAASFSRKVRDVSEFLFEIGFEKPKGRLEATVTYHDPCHLRRGQKVWKQPRELIKRIDGVEYVELPEADWCCGSAGSQLITHHDTSSRVLGRKMDNVEQTTASVIASGCPGCQMQLHVGVRGRALRTRVVHPVQLLDEAYSAEHAAGKK